MKEIPDRERCRLEKAGEQAQADLKLQAEALYEAQADMKLQAEAALYEGQRKENVQKIDQEERKTQKGQHKDEYM